MKTAIVTGLHGAVAPVLACHLSASGCRLTAWDRSKISADDAAAALQIARLFNQLTEAEASSGGGRYQFFA